MDPLKSQKIKHWNIDIKRAMPTIKDRLYCNLG